MQRLSASIQLCGPMAVELEGHRLEQRLPGAQGRLLFAYLAANRGKSVGRDVLIEALWPGRPQDAGEASLRPLVSRLRSVLGPERLQGRGDLRLVLPVATKVDLEVAHARVHDAVSSVRLGRPAEAWLPARVAWSITSRRFLVGHDGSWIEGQRQQLEEVRRRALECIAEAGLALGPSELGDAERAARSLVEQAPYRESGYRLLMEVLERQTNVAEALRVYESVRRLLREELGVGPGEELQSLHQRLLRGTA